MPKNKKKLIVSEDYIHDFLGLVKAILGKEKGVLEFDYNHLSVNKTKLNNDRFFWSLLSYVTDDLESISVVKLPGKWYYYVDLIDTK